MKTIYRFLTAAFCALCLGMTALADVLPEPYEPPSKAPGILPILLLIAVVVIAAAVLIIILRRRTR